MANVLLTVSGAVAPDTAERVAQGARPRADYLELARIFDADLIDYTEARRSASWFGRLLERVGGPSLTLAWACFQRRGHYAVLFTDGEQVGIPLAALCKFADRSRARRPRHLMIAHFLSVKKKRLLFDLLGLQSHIDRLFVYSTWQKQFIETRWQIPPEQVIFTPFMVDTRFFAPDQVTPTPATTPIICSVGLERRDYPSLLKAVRGLDTQVIIAAASPWAKQPDTTRGQPIPENVTVRRYTQFELRQLYADCCFMVMPLYEVEFQAGVTAILEAMAMGRAVICSHTLGQTDVIIEGETGLYVPPGDVQALRAAIDYLLNNPDEAERMGQAGRRRVEQLMSLDHYVVRLRQHLTDMLPRPDYVDQLARGVPF